MPLAENTFFGISLYSIDMRARLLFNFKKSYFMRILSVGKVDAFVYSPIDSRGCQEREGEKLDKL